MIDIEKKTYDLVLKNIDSLDRILVDTDYIKKNVFKNNEQIEWSSIESLEIFIKIATRMLEDGKLFDSLSTLKAVTAKNVNDTDMLVFYALLERLKRFLQKVFDLFLLDQYLYILTTLKEADFTYEVLAKPLVTGSYYETNNFGLNYFQVGLDSRQAMDLFDEEMYFVKEGYQKQLANLLSSDYYRMKRAHFNEALRNILFTHQDNSYLDVFGINFYTLVPVPKYKSEEIKVPKSSPDQLSLFR